MAPNLRQQKTSVWAKQSKIIDQRLVKTTHNPIFPVIDFIEGYSVSEPQR